MVVGGEAKRWARDREQAGHAPTETAQPGAVPDVLRRRGGPAPRAGRGGPPAVGPRAAVRHDRQRAAGGRGSDPRRAAGARSTPCGTGSRRVRRPTRTPRSAGPSDAGVAGHPVAGQPAARLPVQQVALDPVDGQPGRRPGDLLGGRRPPAGVPADRWVFPLVGLESSHAVSVLCRRADRGVAGHGGAGRDGGGPARPSARPRSRWWSSTAASRRPSGSSNARSACPSTGTPTVTGGMAFAGGPFNNAVLQSMAAVVPRLRADPDALGAVTTVSGLLTKPGPRCLVGPPRRPTAAACPTWPTRWRR